MIKFKPNENFGYYLYWMIERQNIFWRRYNNEQPPYTLDESLAANKFCNVYRVLDRSSQYLLKNVIYNGGTYSKEEMFWRILIYKHFNLPSTWELLIKEFGDFDSSLTLEMISDYLVKQIDNGKTLYSNAYMMTSAFLSGENGRYTFLKKNKWRKHQYYFYLFEEELIKENKVSDIINSESFTEMFCAMSSVTSFGDFTTYQYCQDLNYTDFFDFDDNSFCAAGPGTIRGIERTFDIEGRPDYGEIVKWVQCNFEQLLEDYSLGEFKSLPNHLPTVPDFSNAFCETDKWCRSNFIQTEGKEVAGKRMKSVFKENKDKIEYVFPPKWNVGDLNSVKI
jgi:hypothetical protein